MVKMSAPNCKFDIDWKKVEEFFLYGCSVVDVADHFGCTRDTLYKRFETEFGYTLSTFLKQKRLKGDNLIRATQFKKAIGLTDKGDNTLLIWLGKCRLKQKEHDELQDVETETNTDKENRIMELEAKLERALEKLKLLESNDINR